MKTFLSCLLSIVMFFWFSMDTLYAAKVVIDPGHGGKDPGAIGVNGLYEKNVNLDISKKLSEELKSRGYEVVLTRTNDEYLTLDQRVQFTNEQQADVFVSIHANSHASGNVQGLMVLYYDQHYPQSNYPASWEMKQLSPKSKLLAQTVQSSTVRATNMVDRGIVPSSVYVVRMGKTPSILVETGFLSNLQEASLLSDPSFRMKIAEGIAEGIQQYLPLTFKDIAGHWASSAILRLNEQGYVNGVGNNIYEPNRGVTRAEFLAMMDRIFHFSSSNNDQTVEQIEPLTLSFSNQNDLSNGQAQSVTKTVYGEQPETNAELPEITEPFKDLDDSHWAYDIVAKAVELDYLNGYPDGTLRPNAPISRAEVSVLFDKIWQYHVSEEVDTTYYKDVPTTYYKDVPTTSWYADAVYSLRNASILLGKEEHLFEPLQTMTRAEATVMMDRYLNQFLQEDHQMDKASS